MLDEALPNLFDVVVRYEGETTVVQVVGEIDIRTSSVFSEILDIAVGGGGPVVVDLSEVSFMDSSCARVLHNAAQREGRGSLKVRVARPLTRRVLQILGWEYLLLDS